MPVFLQGCFQLCHPSCTFLFLQGFPKFAWPSLKEFAQFSLKEFAQFSLKEFTQFSLKEFAQFSLKAKERPSRGV